MILGLSIGETKAVLNRCCRHFFQRRGDLNQRPKMFLPVSVRPPQKEEAFHLHYPHVLMHGETYQSGQCSPILYLPRSIEKSLSPLTNLFVNLPRKFYTILPSIVTIRLPLLNSNNSECFINKKEKSPAIAVEFYETLKHQK